MSALPPSQAFLNAPDDFRVISNDNVSSSNGLQPDPNIAIVRNQTVRATHDGDREEIAGSDASQSGSVSATSLISTTMDATENGANITVDDSPLQERQDQMQFEMHYEGSQRNVKDVVKEILDDLATHGNLHDWDSKLVLSPFKKLEIIVRNHLSTCSQEMLDGLLMHSSVEEVVLADGKIQSTPAMRQDEVINTQFFSSKSEPSTKGILENVKLLEPSRGRIICVNECNGQDERAVLLWIHALCVRLQNEDNKYIRDFIERHLNLKATIASPYHWQPTSPPEMNPGERQVHYRRVSMSFHLPYLVMSAENQPLERQSELDRTPVFSMQTGNKDEKFNTNYLHRSSASTLMTIAIPEESPNREEETQLLESPRGLWTILMINCPRNSSNPELDRHLTPISQFFRGITAALLTQRDNAEMIHDFLRQELQCCDVDGLFDDENFTKSSTYHRTIQGCSELQDSLDSTSRFMTKLIDGRLEDLANLAHPQEAPGVNYWKREMNEALFSLRELRAQIEGLNKRAHESRAALHGATAVLEARTALQQGQRLKVLAYLATLYLPLTATSSIYSMSVLPSSASFASFFIVFLVFLLATITPSVYHIPLRRLQSTDTTSFKTWLRTKLASSAVALVSTSDATPVSHPIDSTDEPTRFVRYMRALKPHSTKVPPCRRPYWDFREAFPKPKSFFMFFPLVFWYVPQTIAFCYLIPELCFPLHQFRLYRMMGEGIMERQGWIWHPLAFVRDIVRALLLPLWAGIIVVMLVWMGTLLFLGAFFVLLGTLITFPLSLIFGSK